MNKLMPILAAYWGAECKYDTPRGRLNVIFNHYTVHLFSQENINAKLCLRPLWSITEEELRELFAMFNKLQLCTVNVTAEKACYFSKYREGSYYPFYIFRAGLIPEMIDINSSMQTTQQVALINHLRAKGFCVDQELIDANLVEWK